MKNKPLISSLIVIFLLISLWFMYFASPTKAEVERYFEENKCYSGDYCVHYMRRTTGMLFGQIFDIPTWWIAPNFILYTTTPFNYYHDININQKGGFVKSLYTGIDILLYFYLSGYLYRIRGEISSP